MRARERAARASPTLQHIGSAAAMADAVATAHLYHRTRLLRVWRKRKAVLYSSGVLVLYREKGGDQRESVHATLPLSPECRIERTLQRRLQRLDIRQRVLGLHRARSVGGARLRVRWPGEARAERRGQRLEHCFFGVMAERGAPQRVFTQGG